MVALRAIILLALASMLLQCGSSKKVTSDDYEQMPAEQRIAYLEKQTRKDSKDINLKRQLYEEYQKQDMNEKALKVMEDIIILDPGQVDVIYEYGVLQYQAQNFDRAYRSFLKVLESSSGELYKSRIANYAGGDFSEQQVTSKPVDEGFPCFSPDGQKLLFQVKNGDQWDIAEMDLGSRVETIVVSSPADEESPVYSPDGTYIAFTSTANDRRPINSNFKAREVILLERADGFQQNLTQSVADDWLPRYSHDGNHILFTSDRSDLRKVSYSAKQSDVYVMEKDGAFQQPLTKTPTVEGGGSFSADDKRVLFHSDRNGTFDIFTMKTNGEQIMTIIDNPNGNDVNPHVSPNGDYIVFVSDRDGNYEIYRALSDGSVQERLTFSEAVDSNPVFSPDGKAIAYHSNRNGNYDIFIINLGAAPMADMTMDELIERLNRLIQ